MNNIDICCGEYAAKWSLTDFYEDSEQKLRDALNSVEDFDTGWWGCRKEIRYARIVREGDEITVQVSCHMDDLFDGDDLIFDALWSERHTEEGLPEYIIDSIRDAAIDVGIDDNTEVSGNLPADGATIDHVAAMITLLEEAAEQQNTEMFDRLCAIVADHYDEWKWLDACKTGSRIPYKDTGIDLAEWKCPTCKHRWWEYDDEKDAVMVCPRCGSRLAQFKEEEVTE